MPLTGKYLKYSSEITLEIFTLVWDKLYREGLVCDSHIKLDKCFDLFKGKPDGSLRITHGSGIYFYPYFDILKDLTETTVQEILGYDPFVKENIFHGRIKGCGGYIIYKPNICELYSQSNDIPTTFSNENHPDQVENIEKATKEECEWLELCILNGRFMQEPILKQPLKQTVHCKTQKEWDFVTNKLGYKWTTGSFDENSSWISLDSNQHSSENYWEKHGYQILSFQEWCDLNGYKMEKEVKFEVGKWYRVTDGESKAIGNYRWYAKSPTLINNIIKTEEYLYENSICKCGNFGEIGTYTFTEVSIEEIQQYLPDGHPDKIKVDREFKVGDFVISLDKSSNYIVDEFCIISKISKTHLACKNKPQNDWAMKPFRNFRHATPEEINNHLISIGQIPAGEPLNTGIEPNKDGMFKYKQTMPGASWSGGTIDNHLDVMIPTTGNSYNKDFSTSIIPVKSISAAIEFNYLPEPK